MQRPIENLRKRKLTGGRSIPNRSRRRYEKDGFPSEPVLGERKVAVKNSRGGLVRTVAIRVDSANVIDPSTHASKRVKITKVLSNAANRDYQRRGVITRGALLETEAGKARVTSRPSQDGVVNGILVQK